MATEEATVGSAVIEAVVRRYQSQLSMEVRLREDAEKCRTWAQQHQDESDAARERREQCEEWLNRHCPNWKELYGDTN